MGYSISAYVPRSAEENPVLKLQNMTQRERRRFVRERGLASCTEAQLERYMRAQSTAHEEDPKKVGDFCDAGAGHGWTWICAALAAAAGAHVDIFLDMLACRRPSLQHLARIRRSYPGVYRLLVQDQHVVLFSDDILRLHQDLSCEAFCAGLKQFYHKHDKNAWLPEAVEELVSNVTGLVDRIVKGEMVYAETS